MSTFWVCLIWFTFLFSFDFLLVWMCSLLFRPNKKKTNEKPLTKIRSNKWKSASVHVQCPWADSCFEYVVDVFKNILMLFDVFLITRFPYLKMVNIDTIRNLHHNHLPNHSILLTINVHFVYCPNIKITSDLFISTQCGLLALRIKKIYS